MIHLFMEDSYRLWTITIFNGTKLTISMTIFNIKDIWGDGDKKKYKITSPTNIPTRGFTHAHTHIYIYIYVVDDSGF